MEIMELKKEAIPEVMELLESRKPYVLPHHDYVYWIMEEYFPSSNYVVSEGYRIIGFICTLPSIDKKCYFIWQIVVASDYRGRNIASLLVNRIIEEAKLKGLNKLELSINNENVASHKLFVRIAREHNSTLKKTGEYRYKNVTENVYSIELS
jgi:L-2,4-diaminobutyric acid acetyltransferase